MSLTLTVDGERRALRPLGRRLSFPAGSAGLSTTRLEVVFDGGRLASGDPARVTYADATFADRLGWKEVVVRATAGAGWFDDPDAATPAERTAGGYVRVGAPDEELGQALLQAASDVSSLHGVVVEVQWREEIVGHIDAGTWREP